MSRWVENVVFKAIETIPTGKPFTSYDVVDRINYQKLKSVNSVVCYIRRYPGIINLPDENRLKVWMRPYGRD